jgi:hypothetical protein
MPQRIRLLKRCVVDGAVRESGEIVTLPDGVVGPHRTVVSGTPGASIASARYAGEPDADADYTQQHLVDEPMYVVVDENIERERNEMRERHAKELAEYKGDDRTELVRRQSEEARQLEFKAREKELADKQKREDEQLRKRQEAETKAFDKRAESGKPVAPPRETEKDDLEKRHHTEAEALKERHERERMKVDASKPRVTEPPARERALEPAPEFKPAFAPKPGVPPHPEA